ncbi:MAG: hypothetical protein RLZZ210_545 [Pseudomonadota bacterium]
MPTTEKSSKTSKVIPQSVKDGSFLTGNSSKLVHKLGTPTFNHSFEEFRLSSSKANNLAQFSTHIALSTIGIAGLDGIMPSFEINLDNINEICDNMKLSLPNDKQQQKAKIFSDLIDYTIQIICATHLNPKDDAEYKANRSNLLVDYSKLRHSIKLLNNVNDFMRLGLNKSDAEFLLSQTTNDDTLSLNDFRYFVGHIARDAKSRSISNYLEYRGIPKETIEKHKNDFKSKSVDLKIPANIEKFFSLINEENLEKNATQKAHMNFCQIDNKLICLIRGTQDSSYNTDMRNNITSALGLTGNIAKSQKLARTKEIIQKIKPYCVIGHSLGGFIAGYLCHSEDESKTIPCIGLDAATYNTKQLNKFVPRARDIKGYMLYISPEESSGISLTKNMINPPYKIIPTTKPLASHGFILTPVEDNERLEFGVLNNVFGQAHGKFENMTPVINSLYRLKAHAEKLAE